jgi:hypothetical protein
MDPRDRVIALMKEAGIPVTRENYIATSWGEPLPEWTAELEAELPEELQDWSLFEVKGQELKLKKSKAKKLKLKKSKTEVKAQKITGPMCHLWTCHRVAASAALRTAIHSLPSQPLSVNHGMLACIKRRNLAPFESSDRFAGAWVQ